MNRPFSRSPGRPVRAVASAAWLAAAGTLLGPGSAAALPVLSEVFYDASGADDGQVFVELHGMPGTSLDGLSLVGINGAGGGEGPVVALSGVIGVDGLFVVADEASGGGTSVANADLLASFDFQNGPDSVELRSATGVLDALGYGAFSGGDVFAGEGSPAPDAPPGSALARRFADVDTDDNAADFLVAAPTPGSAPVLGVPEPGLSLLLGGAFCAVRRERRRR